MGCKCRAYSIEYPASELTFFLLDFRCELAREILVMAFGREEERVHWYRYLLAWIACDDIR